MQIEMFLTRDIRTVSFLHRKIVAWQTHGDAFRWRWESDEEEKREASRKMAEAKATELIRENLHIIPKRIKRDMEV